MHISLHATSVPLEQVMAPHLSSCHVALLRYPRLCCTALPEAQMCERREKIGSRFRTTCRGRSLAGASNAGLADPGHGSLMSLNQCTVALFTSKTDIEAVASLQTLQCLVDKAGQAFLEVHQEQVQEEKSRRNFLKQKKDVSPDE